MAGAPGPTSCAHPGAADAPPCRRPPGAAPQADPGPANAAPPRARDRAPVAAPLALGRGAHPVGTHPRAPAQREGRTWSPDRETACDGTGRARTSGRGGVGQGAPALCPGPGAPAAVSGLPGVPFPAGGLLGGPPGFPPTGVRPPRLAESVVRAGAAVGRDRQGEYLRPVGAGLTGRAHSPRAPCPVPRAPDRAPAAAPQGGPGRPMPRRAPPAPGGHPLPSRSHSGPVGDHPRAPAQREGRSWSSGPESAAGGTGRACMSGRAAGSWRAGRDRPVPPDRAPCCRPQATLACRARTGAAPGRPARVPVCGCPTASGRSQPCGPGAAARWRFMACRGGR